MHQVADLVRVKDRDLGARHAWRRETATVSRKNVGENGRAVGEQ
jgi:hypothetical protein